MTGARTSSSAPFGTPANRYDLDLIGYDPSTSRSAPTYCINPYSGPRWIDDEIGMTTLLERMASWVRERPEPYPLAEGDAGAAHRAGHRGVGRP